MAGNPARSRRYATPPYGETSEAIYLTQGFVYENSEAAEARFKGETDGFIYARYASPTTTCSKSACACWKALKTPAHLLRAWPPSPPPSCVSCAPATISLPARAPFGSCRWVVETPAPKYGIECTLIDGRDLGNWEKGNPAKHQAGCFSSKARPIRHSKWWISPA